MDAKEALKKSMKEQDYNPQWVGGVMMMLKMNGFEIVKTEELESLLKSNRIIQSHINDACKCLSIGINRH